MTADQKLQLFQRVRVDLRLAEGWADDMTHGPITPKQSSELLRRVRVAAAAAEAYERAMAGVEPPKLDRSIPSPL